MRFVVLGAGAVGGVVGGRLAQYGQSVILIARGANYDAIRSRGLFLESPERAVTVNVPVVDDPSTISWTDSDVLLLATKTQDTDTALDSLAAVAPQSLPICCVQNSVANEAKARRRFSNVYGVFVWCPADYLTPGIVRVWCAPTSGILHVGRYPSGSGAFAEDVAAAFARSSFYAEAKPEIMRWKYRKLLSNLGNAVEALCGTAGRGREIVAMARHEALECFRAAGIAFTTDEEDDAARFEREVHVRPINGVRRRGGSTWQSLERRLGSIETDYLNGEIVELGRRSGVPVPVNALLQRLSQQASRERQAPGSMTAEAILALIAEKVT
jgi:2-dehydropantoate 2-reductase